MQATKRAHRISRRTRALFFHSRIGPRRNGGLLVFGGRLPVPSAMGYDWGFAWNRQVGSPDLDAIDLECSHASPLPLRCLSSPYFSRRLFVPSRGGHRSRRRVEDRLCPRSAFAARNQRLRVVCPEPKRLLGGADCPVHRRRGHSIPPRWSNGRVAKMV